MTTKEQYKCVKNAIENQQLSELFLGKNNIGQWNLKHIPAKVPSDISAILKFGLYPLYEEKNLEIPEILKSTITKLSNGNAVEIWVAYSIIWDQYKYELMNISPFKIVSEDLLNIVRQSIAENEEKLKNCFDYVGINMKNGLMEYIQISNNNFRHNHGVSIL